MLVENETRRGIHWCRALSGFVSIITCTEFALPKVIFLNVTNLRLSRKDRPVMQAPSEDEKDCPGTEVYE